MMTEQKQVIPEGYKQTEIGVIPSDWDVCTLGDAVEFLDGLRRPVKSGDRAKIVGIYPYYGASGVVDYVNDYLFDDDLILLGEDGENILSRNLPLAFRVSGKIWVNNHAHVMKPKIDFHIGYLTDFLESLDYSLLNSGTAQPKLNKQTCLKIKVVKPSLIEQTAIANALSDVDALISELEKLIAKKQAIKTATMQQLLTGKTRLPEFALREDGTPKGYKQSELGEIPEDWEVSKMGCLAKIQRGASPRPIDSPIWFDRNSNVGWLRISDVSKTDKFLIETTQSLSDLGIANSRFVACDNLVMSICATVGKPIITKKNLCIHDGFVVFNDLIIEQNYMYYVLKDLEPEWSKQGQTGSQMNLNTELINSTPIIVPTNKYEQTSIALVVSVMDEELQSLAGRLNKTRQIKQGMMQELLTGKTRLVKPEVMA